MVLARPTWEAPLVGSWVWKWRICSFSALVVKPKPLSPPSSRCKPLEARSWCSCRIHCGNASWLDAVFSMSVLMSVSSSLQLDIVHRRFTQGTQRGSFGDQKVATRGTSKTLSRRMWRPSAWCSETKEELFRRPNCRRRKGWSRQKDQPALQCFSMQWSQWVSGEPTGYDNTSLLGILKHHQPDILIGDSWWQFGRFGVCHFARYVRCWLRSFDMPIWKRKHNTEYVCRDTGICLLHAKICWCCYM